MDKIAKQQIFKDLIEHMIKQTGNQSMSSEFFDGFKYAISEVKDYAGLDEDKEYEGYFWSRMKAAGDKLRGLSERLRIKW